MKCNLYDLRTILLNSQNINKYIARSEITNIIQKMYLLQIDTINVINRSPYVVLWSRIGNFDTKDLDTALTQKQIFEYWAHAACFIPISDYPLFRRIQLSGNNLPLRYFKKWIDENKKGVNKIRKHLHQNGEVKSSDFKREDGQKGGWWNWKFEKLALEALFATGELMVARRENFHRIYTLRDKLLPNWNDSNLPSLDEVIRLQLERGAKALGVTKLEWIKDYYRPYVSKADAYKIYKELIKKSILLPIEVEGFSELFYYHKDNRELIEGVVSSSNQLTIDHRPLTFLSPFDPIVWDRSRLKDMFDFEYQIECYTPSHKRKYGYFTLPILYGTDMIGRFDAKAHRSQGVFEVKSIHFEKNVKVDSTMKQSLIEKFQGFANWHMTPMLQMPNI